MKSRSRIRFMPIGWRVSTSQNNHNVALGLELFLYLFSSKIGIFHKFLYRTFWYSRNYTYFYFPKWRYKPRMVLKITNLHILRYLPTYWLYLLECYTIDNQQCTHTASAFAWIFHWLLPTWHRHNPEGTYSLLQVLPLVSSHSFFVILMKCSVRMSPKGEVLPSSVWWKRKPHFSITRRDFVLPS